MKIAMLHEVHMHTYRHKLKEKWSVKPISTVHWNGNGTESNRQRQMSQKWKTNVMLFRNQQTNVHSITKFSIKCTINKLPARWRKSKREKNVLEWWEQERNSESYSTGNSHVEHLFREWQLTTQRTLLMKMCCMLKFSGKYSSPNCSYHIFVVNLFHIQYRR